MLLADPLLLARERRLAGRLSRLITLTAAGAQCLQARMRLPEGRVAVIPHGNRVVAARPLPPPTPLRLLYFGFLYPGKGIEDLLQALALLKSDRPSLAGELRLTLAGGTAPDLAFGNRGGYLRQLRERAARLGVAEPLLDWRLNLSAAQIPELIQSHHALALPYRESRKLAWLGRMRGTSGALSWAAACGRGAISSDARAFAEEVSHGNGAVFPQGDCAALARSLKALLEQPDLAERWGEQAARLGRERAWPGWRAGFSSCSDPCPGRAGHERPVAAAGFAALPAAGAGGRNPAASPRALAWRDFLGVNAHFLWFAPEQYRRQMAMLKKLGLSWVRVDLHWDRHEPRENQWQLAPLDRLAADLQAQRLKSVFYLVGSAPFASSSSSLLPGPSDQFPPRSPQVFASRMALLAKRYPAVSAWQVWNEPNLPAYWRPLPSPDGYGKLLQATVPALRQAAPASRW
ncbi:Beta-xylosidase [Chromobacterium violaceum]|uniref:Beta-xylosidase n=1 Tax=Chromobacterium violaceum TaxID=536 RepID=A0A447TGX7_CHRVL|nr:Beta-xylosidase [Chromobacterium violaceum]